MQQRGDVQQAARTEEQRCQQHDKQIGQQQRNKPGEPGRQEHGLPSDREAVYHAAALALVEIVEHGHGRDHAYEGGDKHHGNALLRCGEIHLRHGFLQADGLRTGLVDACGL